MTTIVKLKNVDLSGKGLPSLYPFVDQANMEHAFDFRNRPKRLLDLTGKRAISGFKNDPPTISNVADGTFSFLSTTDDGLGVNLMNGNLQINKANGAIPTDGSVQFSILVVGGLDTVARANSSSGNLLDCGTLGFVFGFGIVAVRGPRNSIGEVGQIGSRHQSYGIKLGSVGYVAQKHFLMLTFNGGSWTLHNKTLGTVVTKTNAELGHSSPINFVGGFLTLGSIGNDIYSDHTTLYQHGWWPRVLTQAEIDEQYLRSRRAFRTIGI